MHPTDGNQPVEPQHARSDRRCTYCGAGGKLTREDIFSTFLQEYYPNYRTFIDHERRKVIRAAPKVKDVCQHCNNQLLSALDGYVARLNRRYFSNECAGEERVAFEYDYHLLLRWLLKVWYNDARSQNNDNDVALHRRFVPYIVGQQSEPPCAVALLAGVLPPFRLPDESGGGSPQMPKVLRLGHVVLTDPVMRQFLVLGRLMSLNSFMFELLVWRPGCPRPTRRRFLDGLTEFHGLTVLTASTGRVLLSPLGWDTMEYLLAGGDWQWKEQHSASRTSSGRPTRPA